MISFLVQNGYWLLFGWVAAEQAGLPLPATPVLLAAGAAAGQKHLYFSLSLLVSILGALIADLFWYNVGKRKGAVVLRLLCRISLEPDSCVRRTEGLYEKYGEISLLWSKFVPGLNTASTPVAGMFGMPLWRFLLFDTMGAILWAGAFLGLGWLFSDQIDLVAHLAQRLGYWFFVLLVGSFVVYVGKKYIERRRFIRTLSTDRITPEEVFERLQKGEALTIVDLRHNLDALPDPRTLPGALRLTPEELRNRHGEIPRDRGVILYCT